MSDIKNTSDNSPVTEGKDIQFVKIPYNQVNREMSAIDLSPFNTKTKRRQTCTHPFIEDSEGRSTYQNKDTGLEIVVGTAELNKTGINQKLDKFFNYVGMLGLQATKEEPYINITTRNYMDLLGVEKNKNNIRYYSDLIDNFLLFLKTMSVRYKEKDNSTTTTSVVLKYHRGKGTFRTMLDVDCLEAWNRGVILLWPKRYWEINTKNNPNLLAGFTSIWSQYSSKKAFKIRDAKNSAQTVICKVSTLLRNMPTIPSIAAMKEERNYRFTQRIIEPFEKTLDQLTYDEHILTEWGYCHTGGVKCTDEELKDMKIYQFEKLSIYANIAPDIQITEDLLTKAVSNKTKKKDK